MVIGEISIAVHVINVTPLNIQWEIVLAILGNHFFDFVQGLVTPPALVPSKSPLRNKNRSTD